MRAALSPLVRVLLFNKSCTSDLLNRGRPHLTRERKPAHTCAMSRLVKKKTNRSPNTCGTKCESIPQKQSGPEVLS